MVQEPLSRRRGPGPGEGLCGRRVDEVEPDSSGGGEAPSVR